MEDKMYDAIVKNWENEGHFMFFPTRKLLWEALSRHECIKELIDSLWNKYKDSYMYAKAKQIVTLSCDLNMLNGLITFKMSATSMWMM
jgi:hypothetical protein